MPSGKTIPPEKITFIASSTVMSVSVTSSSGTTASIPEVGFGTVAM